MTNESEIPRVMKHLGPKDEEHDLGDTSALVRITDSSADDTADDSTQLPPTDDAEPAAIVESVDEAGQAAILSVAEPASEEDDADTQTLSDAEAAPEETDQDVATTDADEPADTDDATVDEAPGAAHFAIAPSFAETAASDDSLEEPQERTRRRPSHAAPKSSDDTDEDGAQSSERPTPSHAALVDEAPVEETVTQPEPEPTEDVDEEPGGSMASEASPADYEESTQTGSREERLPSERTAPKKAGRAAKTRKDATFTKAAGIAEPAAHGLEESEAERAMRLKRESTQQKIRVGIVVAAVAAVGWMALSRPISLMLKRSEGPRTEPVVARSADTADQTDDMPEESTAPETAVEPQTEGVDVEETTPPEEEEPYTLADQLTADSITEHVRGHLSFDGDDLSVTVGEATVDVAGGRVQVTHLAADVTDIDPTIIAGKAALRAAALCNDLSGHQIQGKNDAVASFTDVVWVVRMPSGDSYLAVTFPVGTAPSSGDGLTVLAASPRYRLSDSMYAALGGAVKQEVGETPTGTDGKYIWSTGVLPSSN